MASIDWEAAGKAAMKEIATLQSNEQSNAKRIASDIGEKIANDRNADVTAASQEYHRSYARLAGITASLETFRDYCLRGKPIV